MTQNKHISSRRVRNKDLVRRMCSSALAKVLGRIDEYIPRGLLRTISKQLPKYKITFPTGILQSGVTTTLDILNSREKGKKAIYCDSKEKFTKNDIYVSYLDKNTVIKLIHKFVASNRDGKYKVDPVIANRLSNRWCVTKGKPMNRIRSLTSLQNHLLLIEREPSKKNRPPIGNTDDVWAMTPYLTSCADDISRLTKIVCIVREY